MTIKCHNRDCGYSVDGLCTSDPDNIMPTKAPISLCPKYLESGRPVSCDELRLTLRMNRIATINLNIEEFEQYVRDLCKIRDTEHERNIAL